MKKNRKKNKKPQRKSARKSSVLLILIGVSIVISAIAIGVLQKGSAPNSRIAEDSSPKNSIQIDTFSITPQTIATTPLITSSPTPVPPTAIPPTPTNTPLVCPPHTYDGQPLRVGCGVCLPSNFLYKTCLIDHGSSTDYTGQDCNTDSDCRNPGLCYQICFGKPVIYLYPEKDTVVSVQVKTQGKVVVSDPKIEMGNSWTNVLAHPGGMLSYQGKSYSELFYETESSTLSAPKKGIVIKTSELASQLRKNISLLGLTKENEQQEFLDWWLPRLQALNSPYILFSVLEPDEKARVDNVEISPKPDTFIDFMAYFKPLSKIETVEPLIITPAPTREGFTAVEWGGVIDNK